MGSRVRRLAILSTVGVLTVLQSNTVNAASDADRCVNANPDAAIAYCTVLIQTEADPIIQALAYSNRGLAYAKKGRQDRALEDYTQSIKHGPDFAVPYNNRCYALAQLGRAEEALRDCQMPMKLDPRNPEILDSRAYVFLLLGKYSEAIRDYDAALRISPKLIFSLYGRGVAKHKSGDTAAAAKDFEAARALDPDIVKKMAASPGLIVDVVERAPTVPTSAPISPP